LLSELKKETQGKQEEDREKRREKMKIFAKELNIYRNRTVELV